MVFLLSPGRVTQFILVEFMMLKIERLVLFVSLISFTYSSICIFFQLILYL